MGIFDVIYIQLQRLCLTALTKTDKRVENTMCSGVLLTNFEVFGNVVKHCLEGNCEEELSEKAACQPSTNFTSRWYRQAIIFIAIKNYKSVS